MAFAAWRKAEVPAAISRERLAAICLALFVFAGYYKAADLLRFVPVDLTLVFWAVTAGFCCLVLWRERRLPFGTLPLIAVFATMAVGLHLPAELQGYAEQKELRLYSLTALAAFAPLLLLRNRESCLLFLFAVGFLGMTMATVAVFNVIVADHLDRISAFNTNPILLARASGFAALILCTLYWLGRIRLQLFLPLAALSLAGVLVSGTRGPLLAFVASALLVAAVCSLQEASRRRVLACLGAGAACLVAAVVYLDQARFYAGRRIVGLLSGEWRGSETSRWEIWAQTAQVVPEAPLGIGWGRLSEQVQVFHNGILLRHPHNILLELTVEAGWLAGIVFTILFGVVAVAIIRLARETAFGGGNNSSLRSLAVLGALFYWFVCALFSGDVNDNRPLWAMLSTALATWGYRYSSGEVHGGAGTDFGGEGKPV